MAQRYLVAIDQGTTGSTVLVVDATDARAPSVVGRHTVDFPQHYPRTGWVEHDLEDIWQSVLGALRGAIAKAQASVSSFDVKQVEAVGITNQRETLCVFDRKSGAPLTRAIVWQCKRSTGIVARLKADGLGDKVRATTGLVLDPYFSGTKITWLMENAPEVASALEAGRAVLGTIDTYLMARLTSGDAFVTEASNASRTLLYDIHKGAWDQDLMRVMRVPSLACLPEVKDSAGVFGRIRGLGLLPDGVPISGALGDQQAALAGQTCFSPGEAKCTYGTGAFLLLNLGERALTSRAGMLTTVAWRIGGKSSYAFEGSAFIAGAAVQFLRDQMKIIVSADATESLATDCVGAPEVYFVPALSGLGAPYWDPKAQGAFFGLTRGTTQGQLARATLEGIAFQVEALTAAMARDLGAPLKVLRVDGGAAANDLLMQTQADFAGIDVDRPVNLETTAFGAALFAGLGVGMFRDLEELRAARRTQKMFHPRATTPGDPQGVAAKLAGWQRAVRAVQVFAGTAPV